MQSHLPEHSQQSPIQTPNSELLFTVRQTIFGWGRRVGGGFYFLFADLNFLQELACLMQLKRI